MEKNKNGNLEKVGKRPLLNSFFVNKGQVVFFFSKIKISEIYQGRNLLAGLGRTD